MGIRIGIGKIVIGQGLVIPNWTPQKKADNAPTLLSAVVYSDNQIDLAWTNNGSGYAGHKVYLSKDNSTFYLRATIASIGTTYRVNDLTEGQIYYFKIVSYQGSNVSDYSNTANATTDKWYLQSGLAAGDCVAVYEPLKARTLTEARVNKVNPGTYDLTNGTPSTFDNDKGLAFNGSSQFFKTGIIPNANYTVIVKFLDASDPGAGNSCIFGSYNLAGKGFLIMNSNDLNPDAVNYGSGGLKAVVPQLYSGVLAISQHKAYRNGSVETGDMTTTTMPEWEIYLGCLNYNNGTTVQFFNGKICLFAVYNKPLSAAQILAVTNRMNTVSRGGVWEAQGAVITAIAGQEDNVYEPNIIYEGNARVLNTTGNVFKMWHTGGWMNRDIYYLESLDGKTNWTPYASNPVIADRARSSIIKVAGTYYLFCSNLADSAIDLFTSSDGVTDWFLDTENIIHLGSAGAWDSTGMSNSAILYEGGVWYLFYDAYKAGTDSWKIGLATADNPRGPYTKEVTPVVGGTAIRGAMNIHKIGSLYYMWCLGGLTNSTLPSDIVTRYKSSELKTWVVDTQRFVYVRTTIDEGVNTQVGQAADPVLIEINNQVYLYYAGSSDGNQSTGHQKIKLAIADMPLSQLVLTEEGNKL